MMPPKDETVTREHVILFYKALLGRDPENEGVINDKLNLNLKSIKELADIFLQCPEYHITHNSAQRFNKWVLTVTSEGTRIWINLADNAVSINVLENTYEPLETAIVKKYVQTGDTVFDIGTNIGYYSMLMSKIVGSTGKVIGFEPMPSLYEHAQQSAKENHFNWCIIHNVALSDKESKEKLIFLPNSTNWGAAYLESGTGIPDGHAYETVNVVQLKTYLENFPDVSFIKIDTEGNEYKIMNNIKSFLSSHHPRIMTEVHDGMLKKVSGVSGTQYIQLFNELGYKGYLIDNNQHLQNECKHVPDGEICNVLFQKDANKL